MTIVVRTRTDNQVLLHFAGTGWHIDDEGHLHVRATSGNLATIHRDYWLSVAKVQ